MAKKNILLVITFALIICGYAIYYFTGRTDSAGDSFTSYIDSKGLNKVIVTHKKRSIELYNDEKMNQWMINTGSSLNFIADAGRIVQLLDNINEAKVLQEVTKKSKHYNRFEVGDDEASKIIIKKDGKEDRVIYLGKLNDIGSQFARKDKDPQVYLISHKFNLDTTLNNWLHKKIKFEKNDLKTIDYQTADKKNLKLSYDNSKNTFNFEGKPPKKKKLKDFPSLAEQFTEIKVIGVEKSEKAHKGRDITSHSFTLRDDTEVNYKFFEAIGGQDGRQFYLELGIKPKAENTSQAVNYFASISKEYVFQLNSIPTQVFKKKWDDFFEDIVEEKEAPAEQSNKK